MKSNGQSMNYGKMISWAQGEQRAWFGERERKKVYPVEEKEVGCIVQYWFISDCTTILLSTSIDS